LKQDCAKPLDINAIEISLDELMEHYRQALRAVELLPVHGRVPDREYLIEIAQSVGPALSRIGRLRTSLSQARVRHADWISNRFAVRSLARMFLRSHIRSKLRYIADRLEVERLASGHIDENILKRLNVVIKKLRDFDKRLAPRRLEWLKWLGWVWGILATLLPPYLTTFVTPILTKISVAEVLVYFVIYLLYLVLLVSFPLFTYVVLGGFRWKRLILLGQTGDVNIDIAANAVLRWISAPLTNTYQSENRFFETLCLPKPSEFPWDLVLSPGTVWLGPLALSFFIFALAAAKPGWSIIITIVLLFLFFFCIVAIIRPILRVMRERAQRCAR
jgi:hypothetical protein